MGYGDVPWPLEGPPPNSEGHTPVSPAAVTLDVFSLPFPLIKHLESFHHALKTHMHEKENRTNTKEVS